ncbi:MAG TPA: DUF3365 domain-containing protein [Vicinamibacterales bacterium]|nr:DUF3365 domain-containing protein [Vicinamibacterales bacterium]
MRRLAPAAAMAGLLGLAGLSAQPPSPQTWTISAAPPELRATISRADVMIATMQDALLRELQDGLARGGPAGALASCHLDAAALSERLARSHGIPAGRTSDRLRQPANAARPWAAGIVREHAGQRARDIEGFAVDLGDRLGVIRPIAERPMCAGCHGPAESLSPAVRDALAARYPADRAIGFQDGEIRGWYWVEMPKVLR